MGFVLENFPVVDYYLLRVIVVYSPFDSRTCDESLIANGKSFGTIGFNAFSAKFPITRKKKMFRLTVYLDEF